MQATRDRIDLGRFEFESGGTIPNLEMAYETYGDPENPVVLVCHALTGSANVANAPAQTTDGSDADGSTTGQAAAWWDDVVGPGKGIDTNRYFVVCANVPGSCYGSSGPASIGPDGEPYGTDFPPVTVTDWTRAQRRLLDELGVDGLHAVVGGSVGGMNALEWVKQYPEDLDLVVPVATAPRLDAQCLALDAIARRAITTDPNWNGGDYYGSADGGEDAHHPDDGLSLARQIGHVMYLSKDSMERKFGRRAATVAIESSLAADDPAREFFEYRDVESYLDYQAETFVDRFDANSYLYLTRAMDAYDLAAGAESDADALAAFDGEALILSFSADWHFTVEQADELTAAFREAGVPATNHVVESDHGHDAFLVEPEHVGPPIATFLAEGLAPLTSDGGRQRVGPLSDD